jgi:hypothetical protein
MPSRCPTLPTPWVPAEALSGFAFPQATSSLRYLSLAWFFDRLCRAASKRQFDVVMAWSVDRLGRSLQDLAAFLAESCTRYRSIPPIWIGLRPDAWR